MASLFWHNRILNYDIIRGHQTGMRYKNFAYMYHNSMIYMYDMKKVRYFIFQLMLKHENWVTDTICSIL